MIIRRCPLEPSVGSLSVLSVDLSVRPPVSGSVCRSVCQWVLMSGSCSVIWSVSLSISLSIGLSFVICFTSWYVCWLVYQSVSISLFSWLLLNFIGGFVRPSVCLLVGLANCLSVRLSVFLLVICSAVGLSDDPFVACLSRSVRKIVAVLTRWFSSKAVPSTLVTQVNENILILFISGRRKQTAQYTFLLRTRKGIKYIFRAASEEDRMEWVQTLQTVCKNSWSME